jgi:tRNA 2-(methylsulfanyl)-N6-isopentenyladenosine37 hydroxylase
MRAAADSSSILHTATPSSWAAAQRPHTAELLVEQAHLERKAAAAAVTFLFRVPMDARQHRALSALAREELVHFERTLKLLERRGIAFGPQPPSAYAERLKQGIARTMPERLVDELWVAALIEARSHERMELLASALADSDAELAAFYRDLCEAEARHAPLYLELAAGCAPAPLVAARGEAMRAHEAAVLQSLPWAPRLHSGCDTATASSP